MCYAVQRWKCGSYLNGKEGRWLEDTPGEHSSGRSEVKIHSTYIHNGPEAAEVSNLPPTTHASHRGVQVRSPTDQVKTLDARECRNVGPELQGRAWQSFQTIGRQGARDLRLAFDSVGFIFAAWSKQAPSFVLEFHVRDGEL